MRGLRRQASLKDTVRSWFLGIPQNPDRVSSVRVGQKGRMLRTTNRAGRTRNVWPAFFVSASSTPYSLLPILALCCFCGGRFVIGRFGIPADCFCGGRFVIGRFWYS